MDRPRQLTDKRQAAAYNAIFTGRPTPGHLPSHSYPYYPPHPPPTLSVPIHPTNGRLGLDFADPATSSDDGSSELPWVNSVSSPSFARLHSSVLGPLISSASVPSIFRFHTHRPQALCPPPRTLQPGTLHVHVRGHRLFLPETHHPPLSLRRTLPQPSAPVKTAAKKPRRLPCPPLPRLRGFQGQNPPG